MAVLCPMPELAPMTIAIRMIDSPVLVWSCDWDSSITTLLAART
jgi:hypothetical protein